MPITIGSRVGPYQVTALIGVGGMGEVWRARHLSLKRDDALKVLPEAVARDPDRLARFQREAEVLASLNHPNIAQVHGLQEIDGSSAALVMELVEGPTLAERLVRGPLPGEEALTIARQIAHGLEAAHDRGIVHRDLKPSNIKIRPDGTVKVLDFGLATAVDTGRAVAPHAVTVTGPLTEAGVVLGTVAYMSPEQARGERVDARADVWAFGCVLYEMLAGARPFDGPTSSDLLVAVLGSSPDWSRLPVAVPPAIRMLVRRCLARDLRQRVSHMSAVQLVLEEQEALSPPTGDALRPPASSRARRAAGIISAVVMVGAAAATGVWLGRRIDPPRIARVTIPADMIVTGTDRSFAFIADGQRLAYIGQDTSQIFVRRMDALDAAPILTTAAYLRGVFPSPDGQWIAFVENGFTLRKVAIAGGPATTVVQMDGPSRGAAWGPDESIVFATGAADTGLQQVAATGGPVTALTRPDRDRGETDHLQPAWLPGGRAVLFTIRVATGDLDASRIAVLDLKTGTWHTVVDGGYAARYVESGHLLYATTGALWAIRFDLSQLKAQGTPVELLRPLRVGAIGAVAHFDVAANGTLAYPRSGRGDGDPYVPVWVDRHGRETALEAPPSNYRHPRLSPDGRRLAVAGAGDIVIWEIERPWAAAARITFTPAIDWFPVWMPPDGKRIVFGSWRGGGFSNLYVQEPGRADAERLTESPDMQMPTSITPDGSTLIFHSFTQRLEALRLNEQGKTQQFALVDTPLEERNGVVSPDGRWLAYEGESSTRPGHLDIYVRPFPDVRRSLWQVTTQGGLYPAWGPGGRELFYLKLDGTLVAVSVEKTDTWRAGAPAELFRGRYLFQGDGSLGRQYDVSPDGQRFIMLKAVGVLDTDPHFVIVQNWLAELKRQVPND
jgi:Tol biopolymer transport system component